jgi:crotonobetaine/carnitine-CoA ligase
VTSRHTLSVGAALRLAADRFGEAEFLRLPDSPSLSFVDYERMTRAAAAAWDHLGVRRGDPVVVALTNGLPFLLAWHGLNRIGAVMVPLNLHFKVREAGYVLTHSRATHVLAHGQHAAEVVRPALQEMDLPPAVVMVDEFMRLVAETTDSVDDPSLSGADAAAVLYTSGTTGPPKGCITTHEHYTINGETLAASIGLREGATKLVMLPLFHMNAENSTMAVLAAGAKMYLQDGFSASRFWSVVEEQAITHTHYLGSVLPALDVRPDPEGGRTQLEVFWGAGCSPEAHGRLEDRWGVRIIEVFGMTETGMDLCSPHDGPRRAGSCGVPLPGRRIRLLDDEGREVPVGEVGEIVIERAPGMTAGYLHDEEATARLYREGWLHTGDLARRDAHDYFYFVDRAKDIIRRSGENIGSAEVEGVLRAHPDVEDVACIPFPDRVRGEEVHAVIQLRGGLAGEEVQPSSLLDWCAEQLATFKLPRYIEYVDAFPRTPTGKIQKSVLRNDISGRTILDREADWRPVGSR